MHRIIKLGTALLAVGIGSAVATVDTVEHGAPELTATAGLVAGACTALGVTSVIVGWAARRTDEDAER